MSKYILLYKGQATDMANMTAEEQQKVMEGWKSWMGIIGTGLTDVGSPFVPGVSIVDDGSTSEAVPMTGYSIIESDSQESAKQMCEGHPFLSEGMGNFSIELFELAPAPF